MTEGNATVAPIDPLTPVPVAAAPPARSKRAVFLRRLASAIGLWIVFLGTLISGQPICYFALIGCVGMAGLWEFYGMLDHKPVPNFKIFGMICAGIFFALSFFFLSTRNGSAHSNNFEMAVLLIFLLGVFGRQLFTRARENIPPLETMAYTVFGLLYVPWLFNFITKIIWLVPRDADGGLTGQYYVLYLIAVAKFSDMGAYLTGSVIGRHKMVPHISPSKTWEGFAGALGFSLLASYGLCALMPVKLGLLGFWSATILGLTLSVAAVIGDLAESILKRSTGVKDSGRMLPGIGGVLDLIDSLLFTAPLLFFYLVILIRPA
jgi:phosphatidate cytidylyltransferase